MGSKGESPLARMGDPCFGCTHRTHVHCREFRVYVGRSRRKRAAKTVVAIAAHRWFPGETTGYEVTREEVLIGVKFVDCPDCEGVGLIPWLPWGEIEECIACKGTGRWPIMV